MGDERDFRLLSETIRNLKTTVLVLQQQIEAISEHVRFVDSEISVRLSSALEENRALQWQVDPYSNDGSPIADSIKF